MTASYPITAPWFANRPYDISSEIRVDIDSVKQASREPARQSSLPHHNRANGLSDWQIKKIVRHIDENIRSGLRIADLGALIHLSASHFSRNFKVSFGASPYAYVLARRIALAKTLIDSTDEPLSQIAHACGMSDQAHLCKLFRRIAGTTPQQWRQRSRGESLARVPQADHALDFVAVPFA